MPVDQLGTPASRPSRSLPSCAPGIELLGFSDALNKARVENTRVGGLSALTYDAARDVYYSLVDNEGDTPTRVYTLDLPLTREGIGTPKIVDVTILRTGSGAPFTGANFDGEGMRLLHGNELLISSEVEPSLRRFSLEGNFLSDLPVPAWFNVAPAGYATINESFESVAVNLSGTRIFTATERHLDGDGETSEGRSRIRILHYGRREWGFEPEAHNFYLTEPGQSVADMVALSEDELVVLERGFVARQGNVIRLYRVSLNGAQEVSQEESLMAEHLQPMPKTLLLDLASCPPGDAPNSAPQANALLDNFEGIALGPVLQEGRTILLQSDDNFNPTQVTRIVALLVRS